MLSPTDFLRLVVDPVRLAILGRSAPHPIDLDSIAADLGVSRRKVAGAVAKLSDAGRISDGRLDVLTLRAIAQSLPQDEVVDESIISGPWTPEEVKILSAFFVGGRLSSIPTSHAKRLVILERIAAEFAPGLRYTERELGYTLQMFHPDHAALRRYLVDEGFMTRADGVYWRSGGRA